ncbi:MAG: hypothetical protein ACLFPE_04130 [Bacteroidales bacterium]
MKNQKFTNLFMLFMLAVAVVAGCTKEGPQGPPGEPGQDAATTCTDCHDDSQMIEAGQLQWQASVHATGGNFERNTTSCAPCHTSKGFLEVIETGNMETANTIDNPLPINCYTCHNIHETYTQEDWSLTTSEPVELWLNGVTTDQGSGNLCVNCHQPRVVDPFPDAENLDGNFEVTNARFGPHYGTEGALIAGTGGFEVGSDYNPEHAHGNIDNTCVACHMADAFGDQAGGHTMSMTYMFQGQTQLNIGGCTNINCHGDGEDIAEKVEEENAEFEEGMAQLRSLLEAEGIYNTESGLANTGTYSNRVAGAFYNYKFLSGDGSMGLHNYNYAKALLENSIESLSTLAAR